MKILFVAMAESIHTTRWVSQINDQNWDIHLFPSTYLNSVQREIKNVTVHRSFFARQDKTDEFFQVKGWKHQVNRVINFARFYRDRINPNARANQLNRLIKKLKPDVIHSLEFQSAGYLVLKAKQLFKGQFPTWIATNWGSDIYLFGRLPEHKTKITQILEECDYYSCECARDVCLAQKYGLKAQVLPVFPNSGGVNLKHFDRFRQKGKTSQRKTIVLKGTQNIFGRAFVGLEALRKCVSLLKGYKIIIYIANEDIIMAGRLFEQATGIPVSFIPLNSPHEEILKIHGSARISIGLSISDAISTSVLEAMAMGSFPIQSNTSCAGEWFQDGRTGILVPAENPSVIASAIKKVLKDDVLVDKAAKINHQIIRQKLDAKKIKQKTLNFYKTVYRTNKTRGQK